MVLFLWRNLIHLPNALLYVSFCNLLFSYHCIANIFPCSYVFFCNFHRGIICDCSSVLLRVLPAMNQSVPHKQSPPIDLSILHMCPPYTHNPLLLSNISGKFVAFPLPSSLDSGSPPLLPRVCPHPSQHSISQLSCFPLPKSLCTLLTPSLSHDQISPSCAPFSQDLLETIQI